MRRCVWTPDTIVAAIQAFYRRTGRWPVSSDCRGAHGLPALNTLVLLCGSLQDARQAAGMPADGIPKRGAAWEHTWPGTWSQHTVTHDGEEP